MCASSGALVKDELRTKDSIPPSTSLPADLFDPSSFYISKPFDQQPCRNLTPLADLFVSALFAQIFSPQNLWTTHLVLNQQRQDPKLRQSFILPPSYLLLLPAALKLLQRFLIGRHLFHRYTQQKERLASSCTWLKRAKDKM